MSKVGKIVATNKPPMMVIAIGSDNAERDSGIMARIAASAVNTTGRARRTVASTIASLRVSPCDTSVSIWSTKITALRMIMPASAIRPSSATKPNGWLATLSPNEAPIMPSGAVRNTSSSREKLCNWIISSVSITITISGNSTKIEALPLAEFLKSAAGLDPVGRLEMIADVLQFRPDLVGDVGRLHAVDRDVGPHRDRHIAVAPPQDRLLMRVFDLGDLR